MMFAAVGNANNFTCDGGPLAPAAWESIGRPDYAGCVAKSLFVGSGASKNDTVANWSLNFGQSSATSLEPVYEPLVFGVSATNYDAEELSMQRNDATARLSALGFRSVHEDLSGDWTQTQSGTSLATAVVSPLESMMVADLKKGTPVKFMGMKMTVKKKPATKARKGVNPFTGEEMMFKAKPASKAVKVRALKTLAGKSAGATPRSSM